MSATVALSALAMSFEMACVGWAGPWMKVNNIANCLLPS
jgi:hypothetical protein